MSKIYKLRGYETRLANRDRRSGMDVKVFSIKIDSSSLSEQKLGTIEQFFREAKWIYNRLLDNNLKFDAKSKSVDVKAFNPITQKCDISENRPLTITAQMKQAIVKRTIQNAQNLSRAKAKGRKIGRLKFASEVNSIPLKQADVTYRITLKFVKIQGIGRLKANGTEQVLGKELANATLVRRPSGYYLLVTTYVPKDTREKSGDIGLDFGIKDSITLSDGRKFNFQEPIPASLRRQQRDFARKKKGSINRAKSSLKVRRSHERKSNRKDDLANKFVSSLKGYERIYFQEENIVGWKNRFGAKVQNGVLGRIKTRLKRLETAKMLDRFLPTTKFSPVSYINVETPLSSRLFRDGDFVMDRDVKAAKTVLCFGRFNPKITRKELMGLPVEHLTSMFASFGECKLGALKQEATAL